MRIVFFGTPSFVDPILKKLQENFDVIKVIRATDPKAVEGLGKLKPDLFVVAAYGRILPKSLLDIPKYGAINVHPSLLPFYRGPTPVQSAILNGETKSGVTIIKLDEEVDHGPILKQIELEIDPAETSQSFYEKSFKLGADMVVDVINNFSTIKPLIQDDSKATFTKSFTKEDGFIDLATPPKKEKLQLMMRAYYPWPGVWTNVMMNDKRLTIKFLPGKMIQPEGKKAMSYKDFINGYREGKELLEKLNLV